MELAGQGNRGYAMAALLVGMSVMAVLMGALLPVWTHMATREKEEELIFRGNQYARAIGLFQRKFANTPPPTIDVLVEQRFLRKKYKDPITKDDFQPIYANQAMMPGGLPADLAAPSSRAQRARLARRRRQVIQPGFNSTGATSAGGIIGVTSKSKDASIKILNGRQKYNEWAFVHVQTSQRPGQPGPGERRRVSRGRRISGRARGSRDAEFTIWHAARRVSARAGRTWRFQGPQGPPQSPFGQPNRPPVGIRVAHFTIWHRRSRRSTPASVRRASVRQVSNDRVV